MFRMIKSKLICFLSKTIRLYIINPKESAQIDDTKKRVCSRELINRRLDNIPKLMIKKIR